MKGVLSPNSILKSVAFTIGFTVLLSFIKSTIPYLAIVFNVRDRLLRFRPVAISNSFKEAGFGFTQGGLV